MQAQNTAPEGYDFSILPKQVQKLLKSVPKYLFEMSFEDLECEVRPTAQLNRIRLSFWREYDLATGDLRDMEISNISENLQMPVVVIMREIADPARLETVLQPPSTYDNFLDEALERGARKLREIFELDLVDPVTGQRDHKAMDLMLKVYALLDMRKHGGIVQKQMNLNVEMNEKKVKGLVRTMDMSEIDAKIRELETKKSLSFAQGISGDDMVGEILGGASKEK